MSKNIHKLFTTAAAALAFGLCANAQTNFQTFYDFGRGHFTTTLEGLYSDNWGGTFFFVDYDFNSRNADRQVVGVSGSYMEISRSLNFWKGTFLEPLSAHVEYNGGVGMGNQNYLFGAEWTFHNADYSNVATLQLMYKTFCGNATSDLPLQFTIAWGLNDLFGLNGLSFCGFADIWGENTTYWYGDPNPVEAAPGRFIFTAEPQIWYNVGRLFGVKNLNVGSEVELSYNFAGCSGFKCLPCLGTKWIF